MLDTLASLNGLEFCTTISLRHARAPAAALLAWHAVRAPPDKVSAPFFPRDAEWINVATLRLDQQVGRPVLVEFWDFCRANSLRTLGYMQAWHARYADAGLLDRALSLLQPGDHLLISFGHNDEKSENPSVYADVRSDYPGNLARFAREVRAKGGHPVLLTPEGATVAATTVSTGGALC